MRPFEMRPSEVPDVDHSGVSVRVVTCEEAPGGSGFRFWVLGLGF